MKMISGIVNVPSGLSARLSAQVVAEANRFKSNITISALGEEADLKSIMNVMAMVIPHNTKFTISIDGADEELAEASLNKVLKELNLKE